MLYLIRHAESERQEPNALTPRGREQAISAGKKLSKVDQVWHSTKLRAKQTAELLNIGPLVEKNSLCPNDPPTAILAELNKLGDKNIAIVSHLPFLPKLASLLITGQEDDRFVTFDNVEIVQIVYDVEAGSWVLAEGD